SRKIHFDRIRVKCSSVVKCMILRRANSHRTVENHFTFLIFRTIVRPPIIKETFVCSSVKAPPEFCLALRDGVVLLPSPPLLQAKASENHSKPINPRFISQLYFFIVFLS